MIWELTSTVYNPDDHSHLSCLLDVGWEPFAMQFPSPFLAIVWLRRQVEATTGG